MARKTKSKKTPRRKYGQKEKHGYASIGEYCRAEFLKDLQKKKQISDLKEQVSYDISPSSCGHNCKPIHYIADYVYRDNRKIYGPKGTVVIEDYKGRVLPIFSLKMKLLLCKYPDTIMIMSKGKYKKVDGETVVHDFTEQQVVRKERGKAKK